MSEKKSNTAGKALRTRLHRAFCVTTGTHCRMELQGKRVLFIQGCRDIEEYNAKARKPLPKIVLIVDELSQLMSVGAI